MGKVERSSGILLKVGLSLALIAVAGCSTTGQPSSGTMEPTHQQEVSLTDKFEKNAPVLFRIFKEENVLEVWKRTSGGKYALVDTFEICKWSGKLGPKFAEGDRQAPEGFYSIRPGHMNPNSQYHLSFNIGFPNAFDRANGRYGSHLMVHGACSSAGCYSMDDPQIEKIYAYAQDAFKGGQGEIQVQALPFRLTDANMFRYRGDPNIGFWRNLKVGFDHFERDRIPPTVNFCEKRYVFNHVPDGKARFSTAAASCPPSSKAKALEAAYAARQGPTTMFPSMVALNQSLSPSIAGLEEAALVAQWQNKRVRGQAVSPEPPEIASATREEIDAAMRTVKTTAARVAAAAANPRPARAAAPTAVRSDAPRRF